MDALCILANIDVVSSVRVDALPRASNVPVRTPIRHADETCPRLILPVIASRIAA
jgi:hypothetical protein